MDELRVLLERKILIKNPKWHSKLGFYNFKIDPDTSIDSAVNKVSNMYEASTLQEIYPEKCHQCGAQTVDRDKVIALGVISAYTAQGERPHPIADNMIKGYIMSEQSGGQIDLAKVKEAGRKHEALNGSKKKTGKVNTIKQNKPAQAQKVTPKTNKQTNAVTNNKSQSKEQTKRFRVSV